MTALLDTLIPGDADFPAASAVGLHDALAGHERFAAPYVDVLVLLTGGFDTGSNENRNKTLSTIEETHPELFNALIVGVYSLYYTRPAVAAVIETLTGHSARPPQPSGHALPPFDPELVAVPAARSALYRPTPEANDV